MWHQMTSILLEYVQNTAFDNGGNGNELLDLYTKLIQKMNFRLDPMKYAIITISSSR